MKTRRTKLLAGLGGGARARRRRRALAGEPEPRPSPSRRSMPAAIRTAAGCGSCRRPAPAVRASRRSRGTRPGRPARRATGAAGPAGPKGDPGAGLTKLEDLAGIACTTESGSAGKVELDSAGDDTVLFRCVAGGSPPPPPPDAPKLVINEVDYDQVGADGDGFVEIKNVGTTAATLTTIALVYVDGADGEEYKREALTGTLAPGAYLVVAGDAQNGAPDGLAIVDTGSGALIDALSYEGAITAPRSGRRRTASSRERCFRPPWRTRTRWRAH